MMRGRKDADVVVRVPATPTAGACGFNVFDPRPGTFPAASTRACGFNVFDPGPGSFAAAFGRKEGM